MRMIVAGRWVWQMQQLCRCHSRLGALLNPSLPTIPSSLCWFAQELMVQAAMMGEGGESLLEGRLRQPGCKPCLA